MAIKLFAAGFVTLAALTVAFALLVELILSELVVFAAIDLLELLCATLTAVVLA